MTWQLTESENEGPNRPLTVLLQDRKQQELTLSAVDPTAGKTKH